MIIHKFKLLGASEQFEKLHSDLKNLTQGVDLIDVLKAIEKLAKAQEYPFELGTKIHKLIGTVSNELIRAQTAEMIKKRQEAA